MTGVTELLRARALGGWHAIKGWPVSYANWLDKLGDRLARNGPGDALGGSGPYQAVGFGVLLPMIGSVISVFVVLIAEVIIIGYALLMSALWALAAAIELPSRVIRRTVAK